MVLDTKIQIIILIIVAGIGIVVGAVFQSHLSSNYSYTVLNASINSTNSTQPNNTQNGTPGGKLISPAEAEAIANNNVQSEGLTAVGAQLMNGSTRKYYQVTLARKNNITTSVAYCDVDATTGEFLGIYT